MRENCGFFNKSIFIFGSESISVPHTVDVYIVDKILYWKINLKKMKLFFIVTFFAFFADATNVSTVLSTKEKYI